MDDFGDIYLQRQREFEAGHSRGIQEAEAYDMQQIEKEGRQFGAEFVKELAMYESFLQTFDKLAVSEHLKSPRAEELVSEIRETLGEIDFQSLQALKGQRAKLEKKFQMLMAMLGIRNNVNRQLFNIVKIKHNIDF